MAVYVRLFGIHSLSDREVELVADILVERAAGKLSPDLVETVTALRESLRPRPHPALPGQFSDSFSQRLRFLQQMGRLAAQHEAVRHAWTDALALAAERTSAPPAAVP